MRVSYKTSSSLLRALAIWIGVSLVTVGLLATYQYEAGLSALADEAKSVETLVAERLAQHDAHLSGLGAVIRMSPEEPSASIQGLAENIINRYPRITDIETVNFVGNSARVFVYGKPVGVAPGRESARENFPKLNSVGQTTVQPSEGLHSYEIYKLVALDRILHLRVDAEALLDMGQEHGSYSAELKLGGSVLASYDSSGKAILNASLSFLTQNGSQPLHLTIRRGYTLGELLPPQLIIPLLAALAAITYLLIRFAETNMDRRRQEQRAILLEQEAKLAHAGRVNVLGEMASGIAHELAQPIAAILAQSQAASRALTISRPDILAAALEANIREAKRAGGILTRMRAYLSGETVQAEDVSLEKAIREALHLIEPYLSERSIQIKVHFSTPGEKVRLDTISFHQVLHNLLRNAADAVANRESALVTLNTQMVDKQVMITIADNGPGIEPASLNRIFDPFFTTKPAGMGLGLPLSVRLIEKMGGSIEARNDEGARFTIYLPRGAHA